ncbi:MAG: Crp/Fnr family transcriptional regulator [Spirochaetales bacterium]|nr:Crp/Fnr family transcriptional regulator [Spirochaetales bacterium]
MNEILFDKFGFVADTGKIIFKEGDIGDKMFIIQSGSVRISKTINGKEMTLTVLHKGDFFGEMAIVNKVKRSATATAMNTVNMLTFDRQSFIDMIQKDARIALNIIDKLCKRLEQTNLQVKNLAEHNKKGMFALNLHYSFQEDSTNKDGLNYLTLVRDFSTSLGISQEEIISYLQEFKEQAIIDIYNNKILLIEKEKLFNIAMKKSST